ncbi:MAG TPA: hypothetical protein VK066_05685 [Chloroflexota bacterium]|nr:hypothetical protein [Chloroflexota bacterium]
MLDHTSQRQFVVGKVADDRIEHPTLPRFASRQRCEFFETTKLPNEGEPLRGELIAKAGLNRRDALFECHV